MLQTLLRILAPGVEIPAGAAQLSLEAEGISWGWALFLWVCLVGLLIWSYRKFAPVIPRWQRIGLIALRSVFLALLLFFLVHPVLHVTVEENVRRPLIVLLDTTQSMEIRDQRNNPTDLSRAALAKGLSGPSDVLKPVSANQAGILGQLSRREIVDLLASNPRLNLWPRLFEKTDLIFYGFGRKPIRLGEFTKESENVLGSEKMAAFFRGQRYEENLTALGDSLKEILNQQRGQSTAGILVITDGASNTGAPPIEAAAMAQQDGVPLFLYGVGVSNPQDILVAGVTSPPTLNLKEKALFTARVRSMSVNGKRATIQLKVNGQVVDEQPIEFRAEGEQELSLSYTPDKTGEFTMEAFIPPLPEESVKSNNSASVKVRVIDDKINILLIKQEPDWDFQYMVSTFQRDRHIKLKCLVIKGDPELASQPDSLFLAKIPDDKDAIVNNDVIILSDVDPGELGNARMQLIRDWVSQAGGALIFQAGPQFCPQAYVGTPLESLLPIEITSKNSPRYADPVSLTLTPVGEQSPLLNLSEKGEENLALWKKFPGVRWTAWVGKERPGGKVLMTDPTEERATRDGAMPVMVLQNYGLGQTLYIGFNETYFWRSHAGEKYYTRIWGQIIQALSAQRKQNASSFTQLRLDRSAYLVGDRIRISGRIFKPDLEPLTDAEVPATLTILPQETTTPAAPQPLRVSLQAVPGRPGEYRCEFPATRPGSYQFVTFRDAGAVLKFDVNVPRIELADIAMNESLLKAMAETSGGRFLREENLDSLPDLISEKNTGNAVFKKIPLAYSLVLLGAALLVSCAEWYWRRKVELK